jgi:hypothetical protein
LFTVAATLAHAACPSGTSDVRHSGGAELCVRFDADAPATRAKLTAWIDRSAQIVSRYYGRFPVPEVALYIRDMEGSGIGGGRTNNDPLRIQVRVGVDITPAALADDWVLVHEMIHLALPELGMRHDWLAEGLSTYVEGVARAQAGNRSVADVWAEARHSMPAGLPKPGEGGMDETKSWGRTYWGGALFCLKADIGIRRETHNRFGLEQALRAIDAKTGGYASERPIDEVLLIGDQATGTKVLESQYAASKAAPMMTDLDALWRDLGVPEDPLHQPFDDHAPLAAVRIAITAPHAD